MENNQQGQQGEIWNFFMENFPFLVLFILMLIIHSFMGFFGDDIFYSQHPAIINFMIGSYYSWTSRIFIQGIIAFMTQHNFFYWAILDSLLYTIAAYFIIKVINKSNNGNLKILGVALFLMYPLGDLASAGWIATTVNYLWTFAFGILSFLPLIFELCDEQSNGLTYFISIFSIIVATNQEQACLLILGFNLLYLLYSVLNKRKINKYNVFAIIISSLAFVMFLTCPGNAIRYASELSSCYPAFANFGIFQKIYLGVIPTMNVLIENKIIFGLFYIILNICAALKTENKFLRIFSLLNIILILALTIFKPITIIIFPEIKHIFVVLANQGIIMNDKSYITLILCIYFMVYSCFMLYKIFDKNIFPPLIFLAGFMSRFIMGFSPTVFASRERTALYFYMILISLILMLIKKLYDENKINQRGEMVLMVSFILLAMLNYINIFLTMRTS